MKELILIFGGIALVFFCSFYKKPNHGRKVPYGIDLTPYNPEQPTCTHGKEEIHEANEAALPGSTGH